MKRIKLDNTARKEILNQVKGMLHNTNFRELESIKLTWDLKDAEGIKKPTIVFDAGAYKMIRALVDNCSEEIAWNAKVEHDKDTNTFTVSDIIMFPQEVTGTSVTVDETEYANWCAELDTETLNKLRFHGHSHVNMAVSPSGVDTDYQRQMIDQIPDYFIFMIFNKRNDMYACVYDKEQNVFFDKEDVTVIDPEHNAEYSTLAKELMNKFVKHKSYQTKTYQTNSFNKEPVTQGYSKYYNKSYNRTRNKETASDVYERYLGGYYD